MAFFDHLISSSGRSYTRKRPGYAHPGRNRCRAPRRRKGSAPPLTSPTAENQTGNQPPAGSADLPAGDQAPEAVDSLQRKVFCISRRSARR
ncbi:hypothetical protein AXF42_Ash010796 [Apostasia shenzhenica]|uniref:Uncharacterized protein n=1 Tax=Apostasia shenzhenica TaxID=1088818 RepID=A0A2I0A0Q1_9ASPA|nr:hypothetical protein AXF42_Ash010796 [Apostasia shenzhenica]